MAELWYYTSEGNQMDPVPLPDLRRFVSDGILKPTDMVWTEGMPRWARASSVKELFPAPIGTAGAAPLVELPAATRMDPRDEDSRPHGSRHRVGREQPDDNDRAARARREPAGGGSNSGIYIAILFGGLVLLSGLIIGVSKLVQMIEPEPDVDPQQPALAQKKPLRRINPDNLVKGVFTYKVQIGPNEQNSRLLSFRKGFSYAITVTTQPRLPGHRPDVDILVLDSNGDEAASDTTPGPDSHVRWSPREDGEYEVELSNLDKKIRATSTVTIQEEVPPPVVKDEPPLPPGTKTGKDIMRLDPLPPGQGHSFLLRVKEGHRAMIRVTTHSAKVDANISLHVLKDADGTAIISDTKPGANPNVNFMLPATEIVRVRIHNASTTATSKCTVSYDGGS